MVEKFRRGEYIFSTNFFRLTSAPPDRLTPSCPCGVLRGTGWRDLYHFSAISGNALLIRAADPSRSIPEHPLENSRPVCLHNPSGPVRGHGHDAGSRCPVPLGYPCALSPFQGAPKVHGAGRQGAPIRTWGGLAGHKWHPPAGCPTVYPFWAQVGQAGKGGSPARSCRRSVGCPFC